MAGKRIQIVPLFTAFAAVILILDSKTATIAAAEAVILWLQVVIPSLFPLMVLSMLFTANFSAGNLRILKPIGRLVGLPPGTESLILTSFVSGYPTGAKCIAQVSQSGALTKADAQILMACFSNAGPSFIFGMISGMFHSHGAPWMIWAIQILSGLCVAMLYRPRNMSDKSHPGGEVLTLTGILQTAIRSMASICGWVLLFRCFLAYLDKWFMNEFPATVRVIIMGLLELTNGCMALEGIELESLRFVVCCVLLSFGGLCVIMQTKSVVGDLGIIPYIRGKLFQSCFSAIFAASTAFFLYTQNQYRFLGILFPCIVTISIGVYRKRVENGKISVAFPSIKVYNNRNNA